jgi:two-component system response regulator YesN
MYRLLIVDDETIIADGMYDVFSKFDIEFDLSKAYSGFEALEIMKRSRVDIVLTDIRMPGMDGIQLMEQIQRDWPHCKIIFLTGYNDFDYVYKAIQRPGVSYILKTEGYRKVKEMVRAAVAQLDNELFTKNIVKQSQERLNTLESLLQGEYIRHVMKGTRGVEELHDDFKKLNIPLDPTKPVMVVLGALNIPAKKDSYVNRQESALAAKHLADTFLQDKVKHISVLDRYHDVLWLIQPNVDTEHNTGAAVRYAEGIFELIEQACADVLDITLALTLSNHLIPLGSLSTAYDKLRQLQSVRVGDGIHMVQTVPIKDASESMIPSGTTPLRSSIETAEMLAIHLESGRRDEFYQLFDGVVVAVGHSNELAPPFAMECYYSISLVLLSHINRLNIPDKVNVKSLMNFEDHLSWFEGFDFLRQTAEQLFAFRQTGERNRAAQAVDHIQTHIEKHLSQDLSLVRLAELIHFNPSYLSRLFKQECGVNLSEYIEERRVKKAKELLKKHELKIAEVSAKVGYDAPHSFTRFFKKMTGLTPQEYRDGRFD